MVCNFDGELGSGDLGIWPGGGAFCLDWALNQKQLGEAIWSLVMRKCDFCCSFAVSWIWVAVTGIRFNSRVFVCDLMAIVLISVLIRVDEAADGELMGKIKSVNQFE